MRSLLFAGLFLTAVAVPAAADRPPEGARPLSKMVAKVENEKNVAYVTEAKYDDGVYKIRFVTKDGKVGKVNIDPMTGAPKKKDKKN